MISLGAVMWANLCDPALGTYSTLSSGHFTYQTCARCFNESHPVALSVLPHNKFAGVGEILLN